MSEGPHRAFLVWVSTLEKWEALCSGCHGRSLCKPTTYEAADRKRDTHVATETVVARVPAVAE